MANSRARGSIRIAGAAALALGLFSLAIGPAQGADAERRADASTQRVTPRALPPATALAVIRTISLGASGLAAAAGGQGTVTTTDDTIYVTANNATVAAIDPVSLTKVGTVTVGTYPIGVTVHPDDTVYVVNANTNNMTVVNGRTFAFDQTISVPNEPQAVAVSRVSDDTLFITSKGTAPNGITTLSARTLTGASTTSLGSSATPFGLGLTSDDSAYIAVWPNEPRLFDSTSRTVTNLTSLGTGFHGVAVSADDTVYMTNESSNVVRSFRATAPGAVGSVAVPSTPQSVAVAHDGTVYVASKGADKVSAINPVTNQVDDSITVGDGPYGIAVTRTGVVVTANNFESKATILAPVSPALTTSSASAGDTASLTIGGLPAGVLVDDTTVEAISFGDDTVSWSRTAGTNTFTWVVPSGSGTVNVAVSLNGGNTASAGAFTYAVPPPPPPPIPASAPRDAEALAGDASASVSWLPPLSSGSFAVSNYLVTSSPGGRTCLTTALSCTVAGLSNGVAYTFTVKALTGAGWSAASDASNAVTPEAAPKPSITITGSREGKRIDVAGATTGFGMGGELKPWIRPEGKAVFAQGVATILVSMDGTFEWGRRAGKQVSVYVATQDGSLRSNTVTIRGR